jgi:Secretion system C-terminal sorting domain
MKNYFFIIFTFYCGIISAQPPGYVPGTQVCWNFNGRDHGYFRSASTTGEKHILISFTGNGESDCGNYQNQAPQNWLSDYQTNWDGNTTKANGTIVNWEVFTLPNNSDYNVPIYATDMDYFFNSIGLTQTTKSEFIHAQGTSGGVYRMWGVLTNSNSTFKNVFSTTISMSGVDPINTNNIITNYSNGRRHWVWHGLNDQVSVTPVSNSQDLYDNKLSATCDKQLTLQPGGGHGSDTWNVALALPVNGDTRLTNRWLWMVEAPNLSVVDFENNIVLNVYPNPTTDFIQINNLDNSSFVIIDILGKTVLEVSNYQKESKIDVSKLEKGIYFVKSKEGSNLKFIKN